MRCSNPSRAQKSAFSLIELLVVIGIISIIIGLLLPALSKARFAVKQIRCENNIRQMMLAQWLYANANQQHFPEHRDSGCCYVRQVTNNSVGLSGVTGMNIWDELRGGGYLKDGQVSICPFMTETQPILEDSGYSNGAIPPNDYGGWNSGASYIATSYVWCANFTPCNSGQSGSITPFTTTEALWPVNANNRTDTTPMMTHLIVVDNVLAGGPPPFNYIEYSHGGYSQSLYVPYDPNGSLPPIRGQSIPVAYGDGHVEIHYRATIKPRMIQTTPVPGGGSALGIIYY